MIKQANRCHDRSSLTHAAERRLSPSWLVLTLLLLSPTQSLWGQGEVQMGLGIVVPADDEEILDFNLSRSSQRDRRPRISPDGQWITFESERDGNREVYIMASDGTQQRRLTYHEAADGTPSLSPDGKSVLFQSNRIQEYGGDRRHDLWLLDLESSHPPRQLTDDRADDAFASFSPDGNWIVFSSGRQGNVDIYRLHVEDGTLEQLTDHEAHDLWPMYSPDGEHIVFFSKRQEHDDLYLIPAGGGEARRLTSDSGDNFVPSFFPDSKHLIFVSTRDGYNRLYKMALQGDNLENGEAIALEDPPSGRVTEPQVSPDGLFLVFVSDGDDQQDIYRRSLLPVGRPEVILE